MPQNLPRTTTAQPRTTVSVTAATSSVGRDSEPVPVEDHPDCGLDWDSTTKHRGPATILVPEDLSGHHPFGDTQLQGADMAYVVDGLDAYYEQYAHQRVRLPDSATGTNTGGFDAFATGGTCLSPTGYLGYTRRRAGAMAALATAASDAAVTPKLVACGPEPAVIEAGHHAFMVAPEPVPGDVRFLGDPINQKLPNTGIRVRERQPWLTVGIARILDGLDRWYNETIIEHAGLEPEAHRFTTSDGTPVRVDGPSCRLACRGTTIAADLSGDVSVLLDNGGTPSCTLTADDVAYDIGDILVDDDTSRSGHVVAMRPTFDDPSALPHKSGVTPRLYVTYYVLDELGATPGGVQEYRVRPVHDLVRRFPDESPASD
jgi:hypothetical protein